MMTKIKLLMLIIFYLIISASAHAAGGIALGATRIIYPADAKQTAVWIREGANKQVISSQADSLIKISRIWADFFPANTSNQPI